ncbi:MAG: acyltransferase family protein [Clostridia bacterium]|nr:acyltransferase family protein [Clostridia bacterium]
MNQTAVKPTSKANFTGIDIGKFLMAIIIIIPHAYPALDRDALWNTVFSVTVPFFFFATGFLLYKKIFLPDRINFDVIKGSMTKMLRLYIFWSAVYFPLAVYDFVRNNYSFKKAVFSYLRNFLFIGKNYNSWQLWYLLSSVLAFAVVFFLLKKGLKLETICVISGFAYVLSMLLLHWVLRPDTLHGWFKKAIDIYGLFFGDSKIFCGFTYTALGLLFGKYYLDRSKINLWIYIPMLIVGAFCRYYFFSPFNFLCSVVLAVPFFLIFLKINPKPGKIFLYFRRASAVIYFTHLIFISIYTIILRRNPEALGWGAFAFALVCCLILTYIVMNLETNPKFAWLKKIF